MPRRSLTDSVRIGATPGVEPGPLTRSAEEPFSGLHDDRENTETEPRLESRDGFESFAPAPDAVVAAYKLEYPRATDEEAERLACLGLRLEELERVVRMAAAPEPEGVLVAGALPNMDEYDQLGRQFDQLRTVIRLRAAPALRQINPVDLKTLEADFADWLALDPDTRVRESHKLLNQALTSPWGPNVEAQGAGHGAAIGNRGAFWRLLCLSRGFIPSGEKPAVEVVPESPPTAVPESTSPAPVRLPDQGVPKRARARVLSDGQFRQRLNEAARRLLTGDTSGSLSENDKRLIRKNRRLTKSGVCALISIHRGTLPSYLEASQIVWETWKEEMERRYLQRATTTA
jgi:hypothetical protein